MDSLENFMGLISAAFIGLLVYMKYVPNAGAVVAANNTVPYWYTVAGAQPKTFDYASQSNYEMEALNHHAY